MENLAKALEHFSQGLALLALDGMKGAAGKVEFLPAAFDAADAAKYCGIGKTKLFEYRDAGRLKTHEVGGRPKYYRKDLDRLLTDLAKD